MKSVYYSIGLCVLWILGGCQSDQENPSPQRPNIIWLVAEDISPALGCYGDSLARTPNIESLASKGIVFEKAYATAPICAPARSCLVTGLYATSMGTQHLRCEIPFSDQLKTLPEYLSASGYFTTNRNKTDYNFDPQGRWDHWSGSMAPWRHRPDSLKNIPFFSFINVGPSHEGSANRPDRYLEAVKGFRPEEFHDPAAIQLPPYYPDTKETREVWAHYYDLLTAMDKNVGQVLDSLKADGMMENTIIFFFGDHGFGMPRYKRWLYHTGLHVPLIVCVPEGFKDLIPQASSKRNDQLVSFVDFAPSVLNIAGVPIPESMEGQPFLGLNVPETRKYVFAARDRADDMYEMSRAVLDARYIYIRHYMPHLPYLQSGYIYSDGKDAFRALRVAHQQGITNAEQEKLWNPKPVEELYDLQHDPYELHNLANDPAYEKVQIRLQEHLHQWMLNTRDLGLLPETEYMIRSAGSTPYDYARHSGDYEVQRILETAEMVGKTTPDQLIGALKHSDSGVRYWAVMGLEQIVVHNNAIRMALEEALQDPSPSVQIQAAESLLRDEPHDEATEVLGKWVQDERPWLTLQAARSIQLVGENARPLIPDMYAVLEKNLGEEGSRLKYKNFNFAAFTSWALEWALQELGEEVEVN